MEVTVCSLNEGILCESKTEVTLQDRGEAEQPELTVELVLL